MYNQIVLPKLRFEFELEDEMVRFPKKLPVFFKTLVSGKGLRQITFGSQELVSC